MQHTSPPMATQVDHEPETRRGGRVQVAAPILIALVVLIVGVVRLRDHRSLWGDEFFTRQFVQRSLPEVVGHLRDEAGMGPYYLAMWVWARFDGVSWLRLFSVIGAAATAVATYELALRALGRRIAVVCAVGLLCNPVFVTYATELRTYSWLMFMSVLTTALVLRVSSQPSRQRLVAYGLAAGTLIALSIFCTFIVAVQFGWAVVQTDRRARSRVALTAGIAMALVVVPFLPAYATSNQLDWVPKLTLDQVRRVPVQALGGSWWFALLVLGTVCSVALLAAGRASPRARSLLFLVIASPTAMTAGLVLVSVFRPAMVERYLVPTIPLFVIAASYGLVVVLATISDRGPTGRSVLAGVLIIVYLLSFHGSPFRDPTRGEDFRSAGRYLKDHVRPGDAVMLRPSWLYEGITFYWHPNADVIAWDARRPVSTKEANAAAKAYCRVFRVDRPGLPASAKANLDATGVRYRSLWLNWLTVTEIEQC